MIQKIIDKLLSLISLKTPISNGDTGEIKAILYPVIKRIRLFQLLRGLIITLSVALASVITIMVIDALVVIYSTSLRTLISVFGLIITLSALYLFLIKVLIDPISPLRISRIIENRHPEIQERISSALELMENGENGNILASKQLLSLLKQDALQDLGSISINEEFKSSNLKKNIILASVFAVVLLLSFSICPKETALLFARAVAPTCKLNNLYAHNFNIEPKDKIIIEGDSITFTLTTPRTESPRADFIIENKGKPVSVERMKKVFSLDETESTTFQLLRPSIKESFNYRIRLGKALTRTYTITTLPPPCVSSMDITLLPPEYTGMAPALITTNESVEISMPYGTKATLNATFNRPMESMLNLGDNLTLRPLIAGAKSSASFNWTLSTNNASHWSISLKDGRGFTSQTEQGNYEVIPDYPPQVQLTYPSGSSYVLPTYGHLKTIYKLYDDHGISEVTLNILPDNERIPWTKELTFTNLTEKTYQASEDISLGEFFFSNARNIKIWLEISDNLPAYLGGPNKVHSRTIAVNLNNNEKRSILDQVRIPERDAITSAVKKTSEELKASAEKLEKIKSTPNTPQSEKVLQELEEKISSIQEKIEEANTLAEKGVFKALVDELGDLVEDDLQDAINKIEAIPLTPEEEAQKAIEEAIEAMNKAAIEAEKILPEVEATDKLLENASKLDELSRAESAIAEEAAKRTLTNEELRKMQQQQTELMAKIEELKTKHPAEEDARLPDSSYEKLNSFNPSETSQKAIEALEKAKERPKDEQELLVVREIEKAALEIQTAIDKEKVATDLEAKIEQDRAALDQIEKEAKEKKKEAAILKDEAKDVQLEKTKEILVRPGHDEKLAQEILHDSANLLKETQKAESIENPVASEKVASLAEELKSNSMELQKTKDPFLREAAKVGEAIAIEAVERAHKPSLPEEAPSAEAEEKTEEPKLKRLEELIENAQKTPVENALNAVEKSEELLKETQELSEKLIEAIKDHPQPTILGEIASKAEKLKEEAAQIASDAKATEEMAKTENIHDAVSVANNAKNVAEKTQNALTKIDEAARKLLEIEDIKPPPQQIENLATEAKNSISQAEVAQKANEENVKKLSELPPNEKPDHLNEATEIRQEALDASNQLNALVSSITNAISAIEKAKVEQTANPNQREAAETIRGANRALEESKNESQKILDKLNDSVKEIDPKLAKSNAQGKKEREAIDRFYEDQGEEKPDASFAPTPSELAEKEMRSLQPKLRELQRLATTAIQNVQNNLLPPQAKTDSLSKTLDRLGQIQKELEDEAKAPSAPVSVQPSEETQQVQSFDPNTPLSKETKELMENLGQIEETLKDGMAALETKSTFEASDKAKAAENLADQTSKKAAALEGERREAAQKAISASQKNRANAQKRLNDIKAKSGNTPGDNEKNGAIVSNLLAALSSRMAETPTDGTDIKQTLDALREMQRPEEEQLAAAKEANKIAQELKKLANDFSLEAGLNRQTMEEVPKNQEQSAPQKKQKKEDNKGASGEGEATVDPEEDHEDGVSIEMPEWLRRLGFPLSDWLKYRNNLESGLPDGLLEKVPEEYRELVREYFKLLAKEKQ